MNVPIIASNTQKVEVIMSALTAHRFFFDVAAKLLGPAEQHNARDIAVTIHVGAFSTPSEKVSGGIQVTIDRLKGEEQIGRLDF